MAGAEVGDPYLACTVIEEVLPPSADLLSMIEGDLPPARVQKCMREGVAGECRGSQATVLMAPRVQSGVVAEAVGEWRERPWD
jgi:hypothetical protein